MLEVFYWLILADLFLKKVTICAFRLHEYARICSFLGTESYLIGHARQADQFGSVPDPFPCQHIEILIISSSFFWWEIQKITPPLPPEQCCSLRVQSELHEIHCWLSKGIPNGRKSTLFEAGGGGG